MEKSLRDKLSGMSHEELKEVIAFVAFKTSSKSTDIELSDLYDVIQEEMRRVGVVVPPFHIISRAKWYPQYEEGARVVIEYAWRFKPPSKNHRRRAYQIMIQSVIRSIRSRGILNLRPLISSLSNVHSCIEFDFPGYAESGMLPALLGIRTEIVG